MLQRFSFFKGLLKAYSTTSTFMSLGKNKVTFADDGRNSSVPSEPASSLFSEQLPESEQSIPLRVSVAILVIGDEILKGQVADTNSHYLCHELTSVGADVRKIVVIPDKKDIIASEIKNLYRDYRWIVTTGGVGPTHDDVTYEGIASAFDLEMETNETLATLVRNYFKKSSEEDLSFAQKKLTTVPSGSTILLGDIRDRNLSPNSNNSDEGDSSSELEITPNYFPVVQIENILIVPGVPILVKRAFNCIRHLFELTDSVVQTKNIYSKIDELTYAELLTKLAEQFQPRVIIGSYPDPENNYYRARLTFESFDQKVLDDAISAFKSTMPENSLIMEDEIIPDPIGAAVDTVYKFTHPSLSLCDKVKNSVATIESILKQYGHEKITIGFTGGKDCTVVLHLLYAALKKMRPKKPLHFLVIQLEVFESFPEVDRFIDETQRRYGFRFESFKGTNMKEALQQFTESFPEVIFLSSLSVY